MSYYQNIGKFIAKPGKRDELRDIVLQAAQLLKGNKDCLEYIISTGADLNAVWVTELWTDKAAHQASLEPAEIKALIQQVIPLAASMERIAELQTEGGKGL